MTKPIDPKDPEERKKAWKRPAKKTDRDKLRKERIDVARAVMSK